MCYFRLKMVLLQSECCVYLGLGPGSDSWSSHVAGGAVSRVDPDSVGLNPAWRNAVTLVIVGDLWEDGTSAEEIQNIKEKLKGYNDILEGLQPGSGTYFNEVGIFVPEFMSGSVLNHSFLVFF